MIQLVIFIVVHLSRPFGLHIWGVALPLQIQFWWQVCLFRCGDGHVQLYTSIVRNLSSFFWLIGSSGSIFDYVLRPTVLWSLTKLCFKIEFNYFNKFLLPLTFVLTRVGTARFFLFIHCILFTYYRLFSFFILMFGLVPVLQCIAALEDFINLLSSSQFPTFISMIRCAVSRWGCRPLGNGGWVVENAEQSEGSRSRTSFIYNLYWVFVCIVFGPFTVEDGPDFRLSSSIRDVFSSYCLPPVRIDCPIMIYIILVRCKVVLFGGSSPFWWHPPCDQNFIALFFLVCALGGRDNEHRGENVLDGFPSVLDCCVSIPTQPILAYSIILPVIDQINDRIFSWCGVVPAGMRCTPLCARTFFRTARGRWCVWRGCFLICFFHSNFVNGSRIMDPVNVHC